MAAGQPSLIQMCAGGWVEGVRQALQAGAGPNTDDGHSMTPLMYAVVGRQSKVVSLLLSWPGVDANAKDEENMNKTALDWACEAADIAVLQLLLAVPGLELNERTSGEGRYTPIQRAIAVGATEVFRILANLDGVDLDVKTDEGETLEEYIRG